LSSDWPRYRNRSAATPGVLALSASVVLALQLTQAAAQSQSAPASRAPSHEQQQGKINAWTVGLATGLIEGAPLRLAAEMARVVDDVTNLLVLPIVGLGHCGAAQSARRRSGDCQLRRLRAACPGRTTGMP
jgi:hypothetical protein